jgi:hypothetical protein
MKIPIQLSYTNKNVKKKKSYIEIPSYPSQNGYIKKKKDKKW